MHTIKRKVDELVDCLGISRGFGLVLTTGCPSCHKLSSVLLSYSYRELLGQLKSNFPMLSHKQVLSSYKKDKILRRKQPVFSPDTTSC